MSTVLVTGASSTLGRNLIDRLLPTHRIIATSHRQAVDAMGGRVEVLADGLERCREHAARIQAADVVVHLAAVTHSDDPARYDQVNHLLTRRLLEVLRPGQRLVYMSTVCADLKGGAYGASKWRAEEAVRASGLGWVIVRPAEVYGSKSGEGLDALLSLARRFGLVVDFRDPGPVRYAPVSAASVTDFLVSLVGRVVRPGAVYTLCADRPCTARDIADALRQAGRRAWCLPVPIRLLRAAVRWRVPVPFKPDQLDRLVCQDYDNRSARADYGSSGLLRTSSRRPQGEDLPSLGARSAAGRAFLAFPDRVAGGAGAGGRGVGLQLSSPPSALIPTNLKPVETGGSSPGR
jgi:nucleoside-diphosphate-sugar epimerase